MMPFSGEQEASGGRLRIALILDSYNVSAWKASVIDDLLGAEFLEVAAVVRVAEAEGERGSWLFRRYAAWDARRGAVVGDPLRPVDMSGRLAGIPSRRIEQLGRIDALVWLGVNEPSAGLAAAARFGVWFHRQGEAAHFWEVYGRKAVTRSALEVWRAGAAAPEVVREAYSATAQGWSWRENRKVPYWRAAMLLVGALREVHASGRLSSAAPGTRAERAASGAPSNAQMTGFFLRNAARTVSRRIRYAGKESHWFVAYRTDASRFVANGERLDLRGFERIAAPEGHFYADPFVMEWQGRNYLFVEDYLFAQRRGCISVMEIGANGVEGDVERILDLPYHLSYPFVFEHEGELYMIPETLGAGRIELYHAAEGVQRWEMVKVLRDDVQAVDTTVWVENGSFYFFTNLAERGATVNDDLYLFTADSLLGEWKAHPGNPIVRDVRRSRGAGKLFRRKGKLIRPGQDCSVRYGYACQLNEIERLTTSEYRERPLERIEPDWAPGLIGTHTINSNRVVEVIDGQVYGKRYE